MEIMELNDYELLYLISDGNEYAEYLLYKKYNALLYSKMKDLNVFKKYYDDFYQEGLIAMMIAIKTYDMNMPSSFYTYLCVIVKRRFLRYYKYLCRLDVPFSNLYAEFEEDVMQFKDPNDCYLYDAGYNLLNTDFDKNVYRLLYKEGLMPRDVASILMCDVKKVYNTKNKIKKLLQELKY